MSKFTLNASGQTGKGIDPDLDVNRNYAKKWLQVNGSTRRPLEIFMNADGLIVWFYFTPPDRGNLACPVTTNQGHQAFVKELLAQHTYYQSLVERNQ